MKNKITGRSAFLALLKDEGITHLFGNPGTTELPIMHALKDHPDLTYVMAMQESLVVAIADGYSRASGKLVACNVHVAPGLGNAMGSLYNAQFTGTPMILTAGQQEQGHGLMEPVLYGPLVRMAEPLVKWAVEVTRLEDLPRIVRRAAKVAMTPPTGPVFISLPGDILNAEAGIDLGRSTRIDARVKPSDEALKAFAARLLKAERPVIVTMDEVVKSDALKEAAELAELLGAAAYQSSTPYGSHFLSESPSFAGTLARVQKVARDTLAPYDLLIALGGDPLRMSVYSEVDALPDGLGIVQIGLVDWEIAKNYGAEIALKADLKETLRALIPVLNPSALVLFCPAAYVAEAEDAPFGPRFQGVLRATRDEDYAASPAFAALDRFEGRLLLVLGGEDAVIPAEVLAQYAQRARRAKSVEVLRLAGAGHKLHEWLPAHPRDHARVLEAALRTLA